MKVKLIRYTPDGEKLLASAGYNHLVLGMVDKWGKFVGNEEDMLKELKR